MADSSEIEISRLAGNIGALVEGIDARDAPTPDTAAALRKVLLEHKVLMIRDQHLDYDQLARFGAAFGQLTPGHPIYGAPDGAPNVREMDSTGDGTRANYWHTDLTFAAAPPAIALLNNVVCPPVGGDTIWANTVAAYEAIPGDLRAMADQMRIVHSNDSDYTDATYVYSERAKAEYIAKVISAEHSAVVVHPETGERALLAGGFARSVVGHRPKLGRALIRVLEDYMTQPEFTVRWSWRPGDLVMWDNRSTMHYAVLDYGNAHRRAHRVTVKGAVTVGVNGQEGVPIVRAGTGFDGE